MVDDEDDATAAAVLEEAAVNARQAGVRSFDSVALIREGRTERDSYLNGGAGMVHPMFRWGAMAFPARANSPT